MIKMMLNFFALTGCVLALCDFFQIANTLLAGDFQNSHGSLVNISEACPSGQLTCTGIITSGSDSFWLNHHSCPNDYYYMMVSTSCDETAWQDTWLCATSRWVIDYLSIINAGLQCDCYDNYNWSSVCVSSDTRNSTLSKYDFYRNTLYDDYIFGLCETPWPTQDPSTENTYAPTQDPTRWPTFAPSLDPTRRPTTNPILGPTKLQTPSPTQDPSRETTYAPTQDPTRWASPASTLRPTKQPTFAPSSDPTRRPTTTPIWGPTKLPTPASSLDKAEQAILAIFSEWLIVCGFLIFCVIFLFIFVRWRKRRKIDQIRYSIPSVGSLIQLHLRDSPSPFSLGPQNSLWKTPHTLKKYQMDDFILDKQIGVGSFSQVHLMTRRMWHQNADIACITHVAGKIVNDDSSIRSSDFLQEMKLLQSASLHSEFVVNVFGFIMEPKVILMEYHKNGSLDNALVKDFNKNGGGEEAEFPFVLRLRFILQLCYAVLDLHKMNIVHRDLAVRNLLLSDDRKRVVLSDFSLARMVDTETMVNNRTYTAAIPRTSPPEVWHNSSDGQRVFGFKSDIWGLAMTMFEIINMRPILLDFTDFRRLVGTESMIPKKLLREDIIICTSFKRLDELWTTMLSCWNITPESRPQIWEVKDRIEKFCKSPSSHCAENAYITNFSDESFIDIASKQHMVWESEILCGSMDFLSSTTSLSSAV